MVFRIKPRFEECRDCRFYSPKRLLSRCLRCGVGEFFEERDPDTELSESDLMDFFKDMEENDEEN